MRTKSAILLIVGSLISSIILAGCAADDPAAETTIATMDDMAGTEDMTGMDGMEGMDHDHEDGAVTEWEGAAPQLADVVRDGMITLEADGFEFADPSDIEAHPGVGHTHVYVDGRLLTMAYEQSVPLPELDPGPHEIEITLASVDHSDYVLNGEILGASTTLEIEVAEADATIDVDFSSGEVSVTDARPSVALGSVVDVVVTSDVDEELHIHGYDLMMEIAAGETRTVRFTADIPGIFEVEFEQSATPVLDLTVS